MAVNTIFAPQYGTACVHRCAPFISEIFLVCGYSYYIKSILLLPTYKHRYEPYFSQAKQ